MVGPCSECNRLWQEYSDEKKAYLEILKQIQEATIVWNPTALEELERPRSEASKRCATARVAIKDHEALNHYSSASG